MNLHSLPSRILHIFRPSSRRILDLENQIQCYKEIQDAQRKLILKQEEYIGKLLWFKEQQERIIQIQEKWVPPYDPAVYINRPSVIKVKETMKEYSNQLDEANLAN